jgi:hypothetical protein
LTGNDTVFDALECDPDAERPSDAPPGDVTSYATRTDTVCPATSDADAGVLPRHSVRADGTQFHEYVVVLDPVFRT